MAFAARPRPSKFNHFGKDVVKQCEKKLLPHQHEACKKLREWFCKDKKQEIALVSMPTGTGKTGIICCLPFFLAEEKPLEPNLEVKFSKPILVIAPNLEIASQLERSITISSQDSKENFLLKREIVPPDADKDLKRDVIPSGRKVDKTSEIKEETFLKQHDFIIANAQKFLEGSWEERLPNDFFQAVIVDEAHHFPAKTWSRIIEKFKSHAKVVFLTATPYRSDRKEVVSEENFAYLLPLKDARDKGVIRRTTWNELDCKADDDQGAINSILNKVHQIQQEKNQEHPLPNKIPHMAMAIATNVDGANSAASLWNRRFGSGAIAYHSEFKKHELEKMMAKIKSNEVELLVVVDMLQEGFDHPPISIAAILTKIVSKVKFVQFIGRAQRIVRSKEGPESQNVVANVVTHSHFKQRENYDMFEKELLIPVNDQNDG
ncbi:uncharacterized protein LOC114966929 [Acropora millepora]|uniref:uncharacterized protein LOC114966929 n=1 Tax=Acropora millepora TaxID=45264 RepID=UPI001CF2DBA0|nr:uncharacterized protein LOC114966929 [Acropora millepora]